MQAPVMTKYVYQIRSKNGAIVDNLQIYGRDEDDAKRKLNQMYHQCEIIASHAMTSERPINSNFEEVLNLIVGKR